MSIEFKEWPKTPRLMRDIVITEKLDGTNSAIHITDDGQVVAQSRSRLIYPGKNTDNYGFAGWVETHRDTLTELLGVGTHYGEWWGNGIQRKYGMAEKWFSLFNTERYATVLEADTGINITTVPVLYSGANNTAAVQAALTMLGAGGSVAAPGFMNPEGICVYHTSSRQVFKVTLDANDKGKWEADAA
jgi:hypothetical protein